MADIKKEERAANPRFFILRAIFQAVSDRVRGTDRSAELKRCVARLTDFPLDNTRYITAEEEVLRSCRPILDDIVLGMTISSQGKRLETLEDTVKIICGTLSPHLQVMPESDIRADLLIHLVHEMRQAEILDRQSTSLLSEKIHTQLHAFWTENLFHQTDSRIPGANNVFRFQKTPFSLWKDAHPDFLSEDKLVLNAALTALCFMRDDFDVAAHRGGEPPTAKKQRKDVESAEALKNQIKKKLGLLPPNGIAVKSISDGFRID